MERVKKGRKLDRREGERKRRERERESFAEIDGYETFFSSLRLTSLIPSYCVLHRTVPYDDACG